jgi:hypothetical protein
VDGDETSIIPVVISVDVEPDGPGHVPPPPGPWSGALATHAWLTQARECIAEVTGRPANFTWTLRMDPGVGEVFGAPTYAADAHPELLADVASRGDDLGIHVHGWRRLGGRWMDDFGDEAWFAECVRTGLDAFAAGVGRPCRISRIGNRFSSPAVVRQLAAAGVAFDLTMEPARIGVADGAWEHVRGAIPDYRRTPRRPHRLAPGLTEIPLMATSKRLGRDLHAHLSRMRRHGLRERLDHPLHLGGGDPPGDDFRSMVQRSLARQRRPYLGFAIRSDGILDEVQRPRLLGHLDTLLTLPEARRFTFVTPGACVALLDGA